MKNLCKNGQFSFTIITILGGCFWKERGQHAAKCMYKCHCGLGSSVGISEHSFVSIWHQCMTKLEKLKAD